MKPTESIFSITDYDKTKQQLLYCASRYSSCCFLDNHQYASPHQQHECLVALGQIDGFTASAGNALQPLKAFLAKHFGQWVFGHVCYDIKQETHNIPSRHPDKIGFPAMHFFVPEIVVRLSRNQIGIAVHAQSNHNVEQVWQGFLQETIAPKPASTVLMKARVSTADYLATIEKLLAHIHRGDCYEINYCQEFFAEQAAIHPPDVYLQLSAASPNPFGCFYKLNQSYLLCASPERYVMKKGSRIISQPIKGTAPRQHETDKDAAAIEALKNNPKERSENVMVVDMVRNDLSRICQPGTVHVDELFGIYSYPQVHQMISTVSGQLKPGLDFSDILLATFPMGSMTGAPKQRVVKLIEEYEQSRRGLFSGTVGYISPNGNFDFNVVIRSLMYNEASAYLSYMVGSGITAGSVPQAEYAECLLKAEAIKKVLDAPL